MLISTSYSQAFSKTHSSFRSRKRVQSLKPLVKTNLFVFYFLITHYSSFLKNTIYNLKDTILHLFYNYKIVHWLLTQITSLGVLPYVSCTDSTYITMSTIHYNNIRLIFKTYNTKILFFIHLGILLTTFSNIFILNSHNTLL